MLYILYHYTMLWILYIMCHDYMLLLLLVSIVYCYMLTRPPTFGLDFLFFTIF